MVGLRPPQPFPPSVCAVSARNDSHMDISRGQRHCRAAWSRAAAGDLKRALPKPAAPAELGAEQKHPAAGPWGRRCLSLCLSLSCSFSLEKQSSGVQGWGSCPGRHSVSRNSPRGQGGRSTRSGLAQRFPGPWERCWKRWFVHLSGSNVSQGGDRAELPTSALLWCRGTCSLLRVPWGQCFVPLAIHGSGFLHISKDPPTAAARSAGCGETSCSL